MLKAKSAVHPTILFLLSPSKQVYSVLAFTMTLIITLFAALLLPAVSMAAAIAEPFGFPIHTRDSNIIGGEEAQLGDFPYIVALSLFASPSPFCGGILINAYTVVTAAHCSKDLRPSRAYVRAGSTVSNVYPSLKPLLSG